MNKITIQQAQAYEIIANILAKLFLTFISGLAFIVLLVYMILHPDKITLIFTIPEAFLGYTLYAPWKHFFLPPKKSSKSKKK